MEILCRKMTSNFGTVVLRARKYNLHVGQLRLFFFAMYALKIFYETMKKCIVRILYRIGVLILIMYGGETGEDPVRLYFP